MRSLCLTFVNVLPGPPPIQESNTESTLFKFTELPISPYLQDRLKASEFITPTEVQAAAIPHAEHGRDVIATPGRFEDLLDRRLIAISGVKILILDEVDRMLDMGFIPAVRRIVGKLPRTRQTMCFSATLEPSVAHLIDDYVRQPVRLAFGS